MPASLSLPSLSPVIFGLIILFAAVEVALSTWLVNWYDNRSYPSASYRDRTRFTCFVSWWTLVFAILYLVFYQVAATSIISSVASHAGWLFLTWIFWTAAAASGESSSLLLCHLRNSSDGSAFLFC